MGDLQPVFNALSVFAAVGTLALGALQFLADVRRRKNRAKVSFVKGYAATPDGGGHQYRAICVANCGERPFTVEQAGFYFGKRRDGFVPVDAGSKAATAYQGRVLAPGEALTVAASQHVCAHLATGEEFRAFCRIATGEEFLSQPIREDSPFLPRLV